MDMLFYVFAAAVALAAALASVAIWAPRAARVRVGATLVTALFLPLVYLQAVEVLSKPKPVNFEWYEATVQQAALLGVSLDDGVAIYLWLQLPDSIEPRNYKLPWNNRLAEKLEDAVDDAVQRNAGIVIKMPFFKRSLDEWGDLNIEIIPPPLPPLKKPPLLPQVFNPRDRKI